MSTSEHLKTLHLGKGCWMDLVVEKEDAKERYAAITTYDGDERSPVAYIPPHWHKHHDEYITVLEGRLTIEIEGKSTIVSGGDPPVFIPRRHVHSFQCFKGEKTVFRETNEPPGIYKALFFNDAFYEDSLPGFWRAMRSFFDGDTYTHLPVNSRFVDELFVLVFGAIAKLFVPAKPKSL